MENISLRMILALAALLACGSAGATVDPDPDQIGVYFDLDAETACATAAPSVPFDAYVIITNPSTEVLGFQFTICTEMQTGLESLLFRLETAWPGECPLPIDLGITDPCLDGYLVTCSSPVPPGPGGVVVMAHQYLLLVDTWVDFHLGPAFASETAGYVGPDDELVPLGISSGDPDLPVAQVNGDCSVVPATSSTFGRLKATYR